VSSHDLTKEYNACARIYLRHVPIRAEAPQSRAKGAGSEGMSLRGRYCVALPFPLALNTPSSPRRRCCTRKGTKTPSSRFCDSGLSAKQSTRFWTRIPHPDRHPCLFRFSTLPQASTAVFTRESRTGRESTYSGPVSRSKSWWRLVDALGTFCTPPHRHLWTHTAR